MTQPVGFGDLPTWRTKRPAFSFISPSQVWLPMLLSRFRFELVDVENMEVDSTGLHLKPKDGLKLRVFRIWHDSLSIMCCWAWLQVFVIPTAKKQNTEIGCGFDSLLYSSGMLDTSFNYVFKLFSCEICIACTLLEPCKVFAWLFCRWMVAALMEFSQIFRRSSAIPPASHHGGWRKLGTENGRLVATASDGGDVGWYASNFKTQWTKAWNFQDYIGYISIS